VSWDRSVAAPALAAAITAAAGTVTDPDTELEVPALRVFDKPPGTINPPSVVVGRPTEVRYAAIAFGIDDVVLPVLVVGAVDGEDTIASIITVVRGAVTDVQLGGAVQVCYPLFERNWRQVNVAGVDLLSAEVTFSIQM
jgi:hypothetical protein